MSDSVEKTPDLQAGSQKRAQVVWKRFLSWDRMNRVIRQVARNSSVTPAKAADQVDKVVHRLLTKLRKGEIAPLPGVGVLAPGGGRQLIEEIHGNDRAPRNRRQRD